MQKEQPAKKVAASAASTLAAATAASAQSAARAPVPANPAVVRPEVEASIAVAPAAVEAAALQATGGFDSELGPDEGISPVTQAHTTPIPAKSLMVLLGAGIFIVALASWGVSRVLAQRGQDAADRKRATQPATAASAGARPLVVTGNAAGIPPSGVGVDLASSSAPAARLGIDRTQELRIPAIDPGPMDAQAIGVLVAPGGVPSRGAGGYRTGAPGGAPDAADPLDAPVLLAPAPALPEGGQAVGDAAFDDGTGQARTRLDEARARLEQVLKGVGAGQSGAGAAAAPALDEQQSVLKRSSTARIGAARLVAPALTLPRGTSFGCALANRIVSEQAGPVACIVSRNVYGSDGRVLLIERGAHLDGAYHAQVRVGQSRIAVLWERLRMPNGVVVDLASPATGALGEAGVDGVVDEHWPQRIGAALFLSLIDDAVKIEIAREQAKGNAAATVLMQGSGSDTSTLAGKVLDSTVNIPPTIVKNPGEIVAVNVAQDLDFSTVYELRASTL
jgi:type IV secretion system protein VirB10